MYSDPPTSVPNAAITGTVIQNWGKSALDSFASNGFHVIDSSYKTMYLGQQCCRSAENSVECPLISVGTGPRHLLCLTISSHSASGGTQRKVRNQRKFNGHLTGFVGARCSTSTHEHDRRRRSSHVVRSVLPCSRYPATSPCNCGVSIALHQGVRSTARTAG